MTATSNEQLRAFVANASTIADEVVAAAATVPVITFRIGPRWFAIPAIRIREVVTLEAITPVPGVARRILGVALVRGRLVPIVDLAGMLDCPRTGQPAITRPRIIVLSRGDDEVALIADETVGVVDLALPAYDGEPSLVRGELRWRTHLLALLDVDHVIQAITATEPA